MPFKFCNIFTTAEPLSVTDISSGPKDGTKVRISYKVCRTPR